MEIDEILFKIRLWLNNINEEEKLPNNIKAINFGLFESKDEYVIYFIGSGNFDDNSDDWACEIDYEPKQKYLALGNLSKEKSWMKILEMVKHILEFEIIEIGFFPKIKHITIGFDDGELIRLR